MTFEVIDDFLPAAQYSAIADIVLGSNLPYYYQDSVVTEGAAQEAGYFFNHYMYRNGAVTSWFAAQILDPLLDRIKPRQLIRAKVNCYTREHDRFRHELHTDMEIPHHVALWSANDNNGATLLVIDGREHEIASKANRMIFFPGLTPHCAISHTDTKVRVNININYQG